jgi:hypothetical protein
MTEPPRRLIEVGVFPTGSDVFIDGVDPFTVLVNDAIARMDAERAAAAEKARQAATVDAKNFEE